MTGTYDLTTATASAAICSGSSRRIIHAVAPGTDHAVCDTDRRVDIGLAAPFTGTSIGRVHCPDCADALDLLWASVAGSRDDLRDQLPRLLASIPA